MTHSVRLLQHSGYVSGPNTTPLIAFPTLKTSPSRHPSPPHLKHVVQVHSVERQTQLLHHLNLSTQLQEVPTGVVTCVCAGCCTCEDKRGVGQDRQGRKE